MIDFWTGQGSFPVKSESINSPTRKIGKIVFFHFFNFANKSFLRKIFHKDYSPIL